MNNDNQRIAIIGAGPIGLEISVYARSLGYAVRLFERGTVANNVSEWGHVRLFSPWSYNRSPLGVQRLRETATGSVDVDESACPTGLEWIRDYLHPLSKLPELANCIHEHTTVVACGRGYLLKGDTGGDGVRAREPFQLLVRTADGVERFEQADVVIDTSGVFGNHNFLGQGGIPAIGERGLKNAIVYTPPDVTGRDRGHYEGKHTIVVGAGFSGATTVVALMELAEDNPDTRVTWIVRSERSQPLNVLADDPLPNRRSLSEAANRLVEHPYAGFQFIPGHVVTATSQDSTGIKITIRDREGGEQELRGDRLVANVGYHPDASIYRQLRVHECFGTFGPMAIAASLMGQEAVDCLAVQAGGADLLNTPEPNFFILGAKSFGTHPTFIVRLGHEHIVQLFTLLARDKHPNLYAA
jgi:hypothetical protein